MSRIADALLTCWVVFVGIVYFGGSFDPRIGTQTALLGVVYIVMLISCVAYAFINRRMPEDGVNDKSNR